MFSRLNLFRDNIYNVSWTYSQPFLHLNSLFNTKSCLFYFIFSFCLSLVFHGRGIPCQSPAVVDEHSTVPFPLISPPLKKCLDGKFLRVHHSLHHNSPGKNPNANEGSVFLVACCILISGSSEKVVYKLLIVLSPSVSQKCFYYKFKTVSSRLFVALKENVEEFVLEKFSYLWTDENTFFQFCLT